MGWRKHRAGGLANDFAPGRRPRERPFVVKKQLHKARLSGRPAAGSALLSGRQEGLLADFGGKLIHKYLMNNTLKIKMTVSNQITGNIRICEQENGPSWG
jgi:hypothetical protein